MIEPCDFCGSLSQAATLRHFCVTAARAMPSTSIYHGEDDAPRADNRRWWGGVVLRARAETAATNI